MKDVCDVPVLGKMCQTVGQQTVQAITAPFNWLAQMLAQTAAWLFTTMWSVLDSTTLVDITKPGYLSIYNLIFGLAIVLMLIFFCLQLLTGLIRRDPSALSRAAVGLGKSVIGSFVVVGLTATLLEITDKLSAGIVQATGQTMAGMGDRAAGLTDAVSGLSLADPGVGLILTILLASLVISAALAVWFSLLIRKALLLVAIVFAPIAFAGLSWETTKRWMGRWASFVVALSCSKLVLVVVFLVAVNRTDVPIDKGLESVSDPIAGVVLLLVAAFAPYMAYKFISFVGFDIGHAMSSEQESKAALAHPVPAASPMARQARSLLSSSNGRTAASAPGGSSVPSASSAQRPAQPVADGGPTAASATKPPATGGGTGAGAAAAGGPAGAGVLIGVKLVSAVAGAGPKVGRQVAANASDHASGANGQPEQTQPRPPSGAGSHPTPGQSNPWLSGQQPAPPAAEPPRPEPIPPTPPQTGGKPR